jgi:hypothetical protein
MDQLPGATVIAGQPNRTPEPVGTNYVIMTPILFERLGTNFDELADVKLTGSLAPGVLTVTAVAHGTILIGSYLDGVNVVLGSQILAQTSGPTGGTGTYTVSGTQTLASQTLQCGTKPMVTEYKVTVQLDFHSADYTASAWANTFATSFRDEYSTTFFLGQATSATITPLYASEPTMQPFVNAESQYEWRWVVDAYFQANETVQVAQDYADKVVITPDPVDTFVIP